MPRQVRIEFEGATYHVMARGNRRSEIYLDDADREEFMRRLGAACAKCGWRVLGWVLMSNHYHLVIHTPQANLVEGMRWLQNAYTRYFNTRHRQWGRLFGDRYKSVLVDDGAGGRGGDAGYLAALVDYVHLNPARAKMVGADGGGGIRDYPWSSLAKGYAVAPSRRPDWLDVGWGLRLRGLPDTVAGRRRYVEGLNARILEEGQQEAGLETLGEKPIRGSLRRGWYWGGESFKEWVLNVAEKLKREGADGEVGFGGNANYRSSPLNRDHAEAAAREILGEAMAELAMQVDAVGKPEAVRGDRRRMAVAWSIWRRTTVPQSWIAENLSLRSAGNVSQQIRVFESIPDRKLPRAIRSWKAKQLKMFD